MFFSWRRPRLDVWYHPSFRMPLADLPTGMDARRSDNVLTWLIDRRVVRPKTLHEAPEATWRALRRVHDDAWLEKLDDPAVVSSVIGLQSTHVPVEGMLELWRRGVGATIEAAQHAWRQSIRTGTLMGGFHHASPDKGSGFCALNDIATAIATLRRDGMTGSIVVIDLDAHPPDGLAAFDLPGVEIRSLGVESSWSSDACMDVRVPAGTSDAVYLAAVDRLLRGVRADFFFYIAGSDPLENDPLGMLSVSEEGLRERDRRVFDVLDDTPGVVVPGGGYTRRSWRVYAHTLAETAGDNGTVPEDYDPVLRRIRQVARTFPGLDEEPLLSAQDVEEMFGRPSERRFLGHFTRHRIELALDRYGLLGALRRMGLGPLDVEVTTGESPEHLRVYGHAAGQRHRLVDCVCSLDRVAGFGVLRIDWLELADPRTSGGELPGQRKRGLGVAREVGSILSTTAKLMGLDGVSFTPSHYHVAYIGRHRATLLDPVRRGEFQAIQKACRDVPLHALSARLSGYGLPTEDGAPLRWEPSPMIHAVQQSLQAHLDASEQEAKAIERGTLHRLLDPALTFR